MKSDSNFVDPVLKNTETKARTKPTFKVRINHNPVTLKDLSDQINALQRSIAHVTYRLSKLDYLVSRQRESGGWY